MRKICSVEGCEKDTGILTYDGKDEPLCFNHYLDKAAQQQRDKEGLYKEEE
jgi:hypothetical protein